MQHNMNPISGPLRVILTVSGIRIDTEEHGMRLDCAGPSSESDEMDPLDNLVKPHSFSSTIVSYKTGIKSPHTDQMKVFEEEK